ncbi:TIGR03862 family flavoprotein [Sinisalibacter lacisalsi]|uniref:NAD(FAD)-utilizing dehydrogenase n=1 Tax=Sinisalibacter lacisalsi TaxID=1526570 RepID=A0ABQ1QAH6_9RHOB|nr:TIGR03862 family flavoprotein [Sinisalibacter lacisalsi]GGD20005.1 NAD(FAD)-utilizing dehydrogenase [Sinisalibacter lacisalsi]
MSRALVIGAGPAGLMAAGALARAGLPVVVAEAKPSVGRKFLMAGKSGLNLTKDEPIEQFAAAYTGSTAGLLRSAVRRFGPDAVADWARGLGQEVFTGSSGRMFPRSMKASPLLRAWLAELAGLGVEFRTRWRWTGFDGAGLAFDTPEGRQVLHPSVTVLALGGASWPRLGSDAAWVTWLAEKGVAITPLRPANAGLAVDWTPHMGKHYGTPVKAVRLTAGGASLRGEFVISERGLEGSAIYAVTKAVREGAPLTLDLCPDWSVGEVAERLSRPRGKATVAAHLRKTLRLDPARLALLMEFGRPLPEGAPLAALVKALPVRHAGLRPIAEAISTAGGIADESLDGYEIKALPSVFAAGEMLDWEAPTGGYLLTGCFATGREAGEAAAARAKRSAQ